MDGNILVFSSSRFAAARSRVRPPHCRPVPPARHGAAGGISRAETTDAAMNPLKAVVSPVGGLLPFDRLIRSQAQDDPELESNGLAPKPFRQAQPRACRGLVEGQTWLQISRASALYTCMPSPAQLASLVLFDPLASAAVDRVVLRRRGHACVVHSPVAAAAGVCRGPGTDLPAVLRDFFPPRLNGCGWRLRVSFGGQV